VVANNNYPEGETTTVRQQNNNSSAVACSRNNNSPRVGTTTLAVGTTALLQFEKQCSCSGKILMQCKDTGNNLTSTVLQDHGYIYFILYLLLHTVAEVPDGKEGSETIQDLLRDPGQVPVQPGLHALH
jgi:hypothetical protein